MKRIGVIILIIALIFPIVFAPEAIAKKPPKDEDDTPLGGLNDSADATWPDCDPIKKFLVWIAAKFENVADDNVTSSAKWYYQLYLGKNGETLEPVTDLLTAGSGFDGDRQPSGIIELNPGESKMFPVFRYEAYDKYRLIFTPHEDNKFPPANPELTTSCPD
ncbi:MAG: hypothetical protein JSW17_01410 [Candidatus Omnitrophota bacterium]|nr:MAG: hypothetical protein JSW17_01410 [Candidatus Omnitrophota bacterium]